MWWDFPRGNVLSSNVERWGDCAPHLLHRSIPHGSLARNWGGILTPLTNTLPPIHTAEVKFMNEVTHPERGDGFSINETRETVQASTLPFVALRSFCTSKSFPSSSCQNLDWEENNENSFYFFRLINFQAQFVFCW